MNSAAEARGAFHPTARSGHDETMTDPITIAVLQNRLNAIAEEMGEAMLRTAYSQILNSSRDFSIALIDARCRLIAQADHIPVHVGAMPWAAKALAARFPTPSRNDVYLLNDPYRGGSHLPDLTVFVPVFAPLSAGPMSAGPMSAGPMSDGHISAGRALMFW